MSIRAGIQIQVCLTPEVTPFLQQTLPEHPQISLPNPGVASSPRASETRSQDVRIWSPSWPYLGFPSVSRGIAMTPPCPRALTSAGVELSPPTSLQLLPDLEDLPWSSAAAGDSTNLPLYRATWRGQTCLLREPSRPGAMLGALKPNTAPRREPWRRSLGGSTSWSEAMS